MLANGQQITCPSAHSHLLHGLLDVGGSCLVEGVGGLATLHVNLGPLRRAPLVGVRGVQTPLVVVADGLLVDGLADEALDVIVIDQRDLVDLVTVGGGNGSVTKRFMSSTTHCSHAMAGCKRSQCNQHPSLAQG